MLMHYVARRAANSGLKNFIIPLERGASPKGAKQLGSGARNSSNFWSASD